MEGKLILVACIQEEKKGSLYLFLREMGPKQFAWFKKNSDCESETSVGSNTIEEAIRLGTQTWKDRYFRTIGCGFRYTLPERDEHGTNALFCQMAASYASMNGVYFDEELGCNCIVFHASTEARNILKNLQ